MYNTSTFTEDVHVNHEGDQAFLESIFEYLDEANKNTKAQRRANQARQNFVNGQQQSAIQTAPRNVNPAPKKPEPAPQPAKKRYWEDDSKVKDIRTNAVEGVVKKEEGTAGNYKVRNPIHTGNQSSDKKPKLNADMVKKGAGKLATKAALAGAAAIGQQVVKDTVQHGDPLHTAKAVKAKVDEKIDERKKDAERKRLEKEYEDWAKKTKKKKALKESCELLIDESTGSVYYAFDIPEGA